MFYNRLVIRDNSTNKVLYDQRQESFKLAHALPAGSLANGKCYNAELQAFNKEQVPSECSRRIVFYCYTTPEFGFTNITPNLLVQQSSMEATLIYSQAEGELLNSYQVLVYDGSKSQVYSSGMQYQTGAMTVYLSDFRDGYQYFVRAVGQTLNGMELDTGYIPISVKYIRPALYSILMLENQPDEGSIRVTSNIRVVTGTSNPSPPKYLNGQKVDLTDEGSYVQFEEGFGIARDFTLELIGTAMKPYSTILEISNKVHRMELVYMLGHFAGCEGTQAYVVLRAYNGLTNYVTASTPFPQPDSETEVPILLRRVDGLYQVEAGPPAMARVANGEGAA